MKPSIKKLCQIGIVAAIYVVGTLPFAQFAYGQMQFRISEVLVLLCFFDKKYCWSLIIGCFIANLFSPLPLDLIFGTLHTVFSCLLIIKCKKLWLAGLMPMIPCFLIGYEIVQTFSIGMVVATGWVMLGEFIVAFVIGVPLFYSLSHNKKFNNLVSS